MFWAGQIGLSTVVDALNRHRDVLGEDFILSPLLLACAAEGRPL
jgi:3-hydroxyacyl-CoA dehydrogenase